MELDPARLVVAYIALLFSLTVHEAAHAWSALRLGDPTARDHGRVTLNPLAHIDWIGTVLFPLLALAANAPVLGWAKPVPVDLRRLRHWRRDHVLIALAGPGSNLALALLAAVVLRALPAAAPQGFSLVEPLAAFCQAGVLINVILAVFNLVPVPPLDGSTVVRGLLRGQAGLWFERLRPYGFLLLYGLMLTGVLSMVIGPPARLLVGLLLRG